MTPSFAAAQTRRLADLAALYPVGRAVQHAETGWRGTITPDHPSNIPGTWEPARPWVALVGSGATVCVAFDHDGRRWLAWMRTSVLVAPGRTVHRPAPVRARPEPAPPRDRQRTRAHQPVNRGR